MPITSDSALDGAFVLLRLSFVDSSSVSYNYYSEIKISLET